MREMEQCPHCGHFQPENALKQPGHEAQGHRDRIAELTAQISLLTAERNAIQAELDSIVFPVLTLPPEITSEIFVNCLPGQPQDPEPLVAPLLLTGICRNWRTIALSTPELWSILSLRLDSPEVQNALADLLPTWLSRSGVHPLTLRFRYEADYDNDDSSPRIFCETLLQHAHHWYDVTLRLPHADFIQLFDDYPARFSSLRRLDIRYTDAIANPSCSFATLQGCHELRVLSVGKDVAVPVPHFPRWDQLTHFRGQHMAWKDGWELLSLASSLQKCSLRLDIRTVADLVQARRSAHIRLRHLRSLEIATNVASLSQCLDFLTLPALEELIVSAFNTPDIEPLLGLIARSDCRITRFDMACHTEATDFVQLFTALPHLVHFCPTLTPNFGFDLASNAFFSILHRDNGHLPNLNTLVIRGQGTYHGRRLLDMLESRYDVTEEGAQVLKIFELQGFYHVLDPNSVHINRLNSLIKRGMRVTLKEFTSLTSGFVSW
ncbi:hypothetical protein C8J57DRAFT_1275679 [Mycena rebaudengoi]|nr:hypothetical protein C8J57DRAFT_1275679 [Mycena rebaudengoi]